jgi:hypothetical protein
MARKSKPAKSKPDADVGRDQYHASHIGAGATVAQGKNKISIITHQGRNEAELTTLFQALYQHIEKRPQTKIADKEEITETVQRIETEITQNGEQADQTRLQRWMDYLNNMAPDIVDVILSSLGGPVSAASAVLRKVAERARQPA